MKRLLKMALTLLVVLSTVATVFAMDLISTAFVEQPADAMADEDMLMQTPMSTPVYMNPDLTMANPGDKALAEQTINGYTVKIIKAKRSIEKQIVSYDEPAKDVQVISLDVCYTTPDIGEWYLHGTDDMLRTESVVSQGWEEKFNIWNEKFADGEQNGERCVRYFYSFDLETVLTPPMTVEFSELKTIPRGGFHPCAEMIQRFETNPRARDAGIKIGCYETPTGNPLGVDPLFDTHIYLESFDSSVFTKQEAHVLMLEIESGVIYGPWVFGITPTD